MNSNFLSNPDPILRPLFLDLAKTNINSFLATSFFGRYAIKLGIQDIWDKELKEAEQAQSYITHNSQIELSLKALFNLLKKCYRIKIQLFYEIVHSILFGYIQWLDEKTDLNDIFKDLEIIEFPENWLFELKQMHLKQSIIIDARIISKTKRLHNNPLPYKEEARKKAEKWVNDLANAKEEELIVELLSFAHKHVLKETTEEIVMQSNRWKRLQKKIRNGTIDLPSEDLESNRINKALLEIIEKLQHQ